MYCAVLRAAQNRGPDYVRVFIGAVLVNAITQLNWLLTKNALICDTREVIEMNYPNNLNTRCSERVAHMSG